MPNEIYTPGDIFLTTSTDLVDRVIQTGEAIRHSKLSSKWSHAGIIVSPGGDTVEALAKGVERSHLFAAEDFIVLDVGMTYDNRVKVVNFAESQVGYRYDYFQDVLLGIDCLTGWHLHNHPDGAWICSELAAASLVAGGWVPKVPVNETMPSDLYLEFPKRVNL